MASHLPGVLGRIIAHKQGEVAEIKRTVDMARLDDEVRAAPPARDLPSALRSCAGAAVIAEIKRRSPSAGQLAEGVNPVERARAYQAGGAAAISVITDHEFFGGSLDDLRQVRAAVEVPILRKDFIIDRVQVLQARAAGADAVLLIISVLAPALLAELHQQACELGMTPLLEIHEADEIEPALAVRPALLGINNRDLRTMNVDLGHCLELRRRIPAEVTVVAESGVHGGDDIRRLTAGGLDAFLVGSALMANPDPQALLANMVGAVAGHG